MSTPNNRILWLDAVKGYGILMVLASHMLQVPQLGKELFSFYIPLFFIASGYTIKKGLTPKDFLFKKSKRLLLPYLIYGSLFTLFYICIRNFNFFELTNSDQTQPIIGLFYSRYCLFEYGTDPNVYFLPFEATSTLWFLTALFTGSAIYYLTTHFVRTNNYQNVLFLSYLAITIILAQLRVLLPWSLDCAFLTASFIWLGKKLSEAKVYYLTIKKQIIIFLLSAIIMHLLYLYNGDANYSVRIFGADNTVSIPLFFVASLFYFLTVSLFFHLCPLIIQRTFAFVGRISMPMMCIQLPVIFLFRQSILCSYVHSQSLHFLIVSAICIVLSYAIEKWT